MDKLLENLEAIANYFKRTIDLSDGMIDGALIFNEHTPVLVQCYETTLLILKSVFSWTGFLASDQRMLLKKGTASIIRPKYRRPDFRQ